jgi:hypothetical protein
MTLIAHAILAIPLAFGLADHPSFEATRQDTVCLWLQYDTDTGNGDVFADFVTGQPQMEMANVFDVPRYFDDAELYLSGAAVFVKDHFDTVDTSPFRLKVRNVYEGGTPGQEFFSQDIPGGYPIEEWLLIDLTTETTPGLPVEDRTAFSVGVYCLERYNPYIGVQAIDEPHLRSYRWNWSTWQLYAYGDFGIRAKVCAIPTSGAEESAWATVKTLFR